MASKVTRDHHRWTRDITADANDVKITLKDSTSAQLSIISDGANAPILSLEGKNQQTNASPVLDFTTQRDTDTAGQVGDIIGYIRFRGYNDASTPDDKNFVSISGQIHDFTENEESGKLLLQVASHDGGLENGLVLTGGSVDAEVDVTIGNGAASLTTIAGDLDIDGDTITTAGDITLDGAGDVILDAHTYGEGEGVIFKAAGTKIGDITGHHTGTFLTLYENVGASTDDFVSLACYANGATILTTVDAAGALADFTLDIDGKITLDSSTGKFITKQNGTEFSVASSAYAGMILGYRVIGEDVAAAHSGDLGTSFATINDACSVTFKAPPSGKVEITVQAYIVTSSNSEVIEFGLSTTDTTSYTSLGVQYEQKVFQGDRSEDGVIQLSWVVTGLVAGAIDTYWLAAEATTGNTRLYWGGDATSGYPDFIMKVIALPEATTDYAVYG